MPSEASILRSVTIPDVLPSDLPENSDFSLVAGDFEEIYGISDEDALKDETKEPQEGRWHAVVTCFFIDTVSVYSKALLLVVIQSSLGQGCCKLFESHTSDLGTWWNMDKPWYADPVSSDEMN